MLSASGFLVAVAILSLVFTGLNAQYRWSCSALDVTNDRYYLPDLLQNSISRFDISENLGPSDPESVFIFPLPPELNCSGIVSEIRYCYDGYEIFETDDDFHVFTILILEQNEFTFRVVDVIHVSFTETSECYRKRLFCCDTLILDEEDRFLLPASGFAFGIISSSLLAIRAPVLTQYLVDHYEFPLELLPSTSFTSFTLNEGYRGSDRALRLNIIPLPATELPTTRQSTTTTTNADSTTTTTTNLVTTDTSNDDITTNTTLQQTAGVGFIVGVAAGGGGAFAIVIVLALVIVIAVIVAVSRSRTQEEESSQSDPVDQTNEPYGPSLHGIVPEPRNTWGASASYYNTNPSLAPGSTTVTTTTHFLASEHTKDAEFYCNIPMPETSVYAQPLPHHSLETALSPTPSGKEDTNNSRMAESSNNYDYVQEMNGSPKVKTTANEAYGLSLSYRNRITTDTVEDENHEYVNTTNFI